MPRRFQFSPSSLTGNNFLQKHRTVRICLSRLQCADSLVCPFWWLIKIKLYMNESAWAPTKNPINKKVRTFDLRADLALRNTSVMTTRTASGGSEATLKN